MGAFHKQESTEWPRQNLLSSVGIGYQFSRVRTRGARTSGFVTSRTRVAHPMRGAEHVVRGARFWQDRVATACTGQWYVALADGSAIADASHFNWNPRARG